ncbi:MAG: hypothetical protein JNK65_04375, partial [Deltaproteobacteria bacterium]|nr:hypothetical protein [Deltaproteobacteria bacterium]
MKTHKKSQKFHVWIHSKNLEIAFGILYQLGIDTLEEKKTQQGIRLTGEIPKKYSVLQWKKHL